MLSRTDHLWGSGVDSREARRQQRLTYGAELRAQIAEKEYTKKTKSSIHYNPKTNYISDSSNVAPMPISMAPQPYMPTDLLPRTQPIKLPTIYNPPVNTEDSFGVTTQVKPIPVIPHFNTYEQELTKGISIRSNLSSTTRPMIFPLTVQSPVPTFHDTTTFNRPSFVLSKATFRTSSSANYDKINPISFNQVHSVKNSIIQEIQNTPGINTESPLHRSSVDTPPSGFTRRQKEYKFANGAPSFF